MYRLSWPVVVDAARSVVERYDTLVTLRQLYYVLGAEGVIPLTAPVYRRLSAQLAAARRRREFPELIDPGRQVHRRPAYANAGELLAIVPELFRLDRTGGQSVALYVGVEKDTLRIQVTDWVDRYGVPVLVVRGYGSQSYADDVADRVHADGRPAVLLYIGDLDASGEDIERDWIARTACWTEVRRVAVTIDQAQRLPPAPGKSHDPRWPSFAARHGLDAHAPVQYEAEAIEPGSLRDLLLTAVDELVDAEQLEQVIAAEHEQRHRLDGFLRSWQGP